MENTISPKTMDKKHEEYQYLDLISLIIKNGYWEIGRNGKTKSIFGATMRFSLQNGKMPIITTKKTAWKTCLKELLWFIRGDTDNKLLQNEGVHIWDGNASREFLDSRGLNNYREGILGPIYGYQWRQFNAPYNECDGTVDEGRYSNKNKQTDDDGIDQLQQIIDALKDPLQRTSRRLIMTAWNPLQLDEMALPPCHILCQFNVREGTKLSCALYARSQDLPLGTPFNIASYAFLTHLLAKHCDLDAYEVVIFMGNCHIYEEHLKDIEVIVERNPFEFPTLEISNKKKSIDSYSVDDFIIHNYNFHESIKMNMKA